MRPIFLARPAWPNSSRGAAFHGAVDGAFAGDTINRRRWGNGRDGGPASAGFNASAGLPRGGGMHRRITHRRAMAIRWFFADATESRPNPRDGAPVIGLLETMACAIPMWTVRKLLSAHAFVARDVIRAALSKSGSASRSNFSRCLFKNSIALKPALKFSKRFLQEKVPSTRRPPRDNLSEDRIG